MNFATKQALVQAMKPEARKEVSALQDFQAWQQFLADLGTGQTHAQRIKSLGGIGTALRLFRTEVIYLEDAL